MVLLNRQMPASVVRTFVVLVTLIGLSLQPCHGQEDNVKNFKNTIRLNITNPMLFSWRFYVIGYERVTKDYQTFSVNMGRTGFDTFWFNNDSLDLLDQLNDKGFNFSVDYRFYLQKENKYRAPRGVYIGPYYAFNYFSRDMIWDLSTETYDGQVQLSTDINAHFIGVQLGYQFVFWNRLTVDMILMGPSLWHFNLKSSLDTDLPVEDEAMLIETVNEMFQEKFPGSDFMITGEGLEATKTTSTSTMGFRYMINVGFRF